MGIVIRTAAPEDASAACEVLRRSILECCTADHQHKPELLAAWLGNKTPENVAAWFSSPTNFALVAERGGQVVGVALMNQAGKVSLCYVLPEALHIGAGKAMLEGLERQARVWGIGTLRLHSTVTAREFYTRHGYINAGREKSCFGLDCELLWKKLDAPADAPARKRFCTCSTE